VLNFSFEPIKADKKKKANLAALEEWQHVDCLGPMAQEYIQDEALHHLIPSNETAAEESMDIDDDAASNPDRQLSVEEVPDGSMTFVFERKPKPDEE